MSTRKGPKLHEEFKSIYPASCACQAEKGLVSGVRWECYNSESKACYRRKCRFAFVCVENVRESMTCTKMTRRKKVLPNGDGTCSTVKPEMIAYVPYA